MADADVAQRALLVAHRSILTTEDVHRRLTEVPELDEALELVVRDGLASRLGELAGVTRAAVRGAQLR